MHLLSQYNVDTVFGIPGTHSLEFYRGIASSGLRHIQARHEQGAGFMADGYARVSGKPGVCVVISGPGVTNAATPLGQAYADSIPLLLISSAPPSASLGKGWGALHEISDQQAVTAPLTALSATVRTPADVPELIGQAFALFAAARPRPVHISIPTDVLSQPVTDRWSVRKLLARPQPDPAAVQSAADLLYSAQRPIMLVGGGMVDAAPGCVTQLAEWLGAAVITSNAGKGVVPDEHPLNLGASIARPSIQRYLSQADVILALGTELADADSFVERLPIQGKVIRVDLDPRKINDLYPAEIGMVADGGATVGQLLVALQQRPQPLRSSVMEELIQVRVQVADELSAGERQHQHICQVLRAALPADSVIMGDMTQLVYTGSFAFPVAAPRRWFYAAGYCTLGCALPMAIGAKLAAPHLPVVTLAGDGGLLFTVQELATAVELELSLPIILWNNDGYQEIHDGMKRRSIPPIGVTGRNPDFVALARAFGGRGVQATTAANLTQAVTEALRTPLPTLIEVRQDRFEG